MNRFLVGFAAFLLTVVVYAGTGNNSKTGNPGNGSVTSVGVTSTGGTLTVTNSPITTSGNINIEDPGMSNVYAVTSAAYGAKCDGSTDDSTAIQNAINAAQNTGGRVRFPAGTCLINSQLVMPNDGGSPVPKQRPIILEGAGPHMVGRGSPNPYGGTILDMRTSATDGKIVTYGLGYLEIRNLTLYDGGTNSNRFILTTNTTLHIEHTGFVGNPSKSGATCDQDAIVLGGTTSNFDGTPSAAYQGYASVITQNYFLKIRRAFYCRSDCNGNMFVNNNIWTGSGTNLASGAAIEFDGSGGVNPQGNYVAGNLIENTSYIYGIKVVNGGNNTFAANDNFDASGSTVAAVRIESGSSGRNLTIGALAGGTPAIYFSDAMSPSNNTYFSTDQSKLSQLQPLHIFSDGGTYSLIDKVSFDGTGGSQTIIQPSATETGGTSVLQVLRSAAEGTNPGGVTFEVDYNGNLTMGDGSGTVGAAFTNSGKTWTAGIGGGSGGNIIINSGTGGSGLRLQNNNTTIESNTGTVQTKFGSNIGWGNSGEQMAFGASSDAILTRVAADTITMNRSTNAQTFCQSNTYTSTTSYERGCETWSGNDYQIVTQKGSGGGSARDLVLFPATGHTYIKGTTPTVGSGSTDCGTTPAIAGNDNVARITVGSSTNGGKCTVTFANTATWATTPICTCNDETTSVLCSAKSPSTTTVALTGVFVAGDTIGMICMDYK